MCHALVTKDGPSCDECRVTICVTTGLLRMAPVVMNVE